MGFDGWDQGGGREPRPHIAHSNANWQPMCNLSSPPVSTPATLDVGATVARAVQGRAVKGAVSFNRDGGADGTAVARAAR